MPHVLGESRAPAHSRWEKGTVCSAVAGQTLLNTHTVSKLGKTIKYLSKTITQW